MAQQFLDGPQVVAVFEKVGGKRVAQRVRRRGLRDAGPPHGLAHRPLNHRLVQMVPVLYPCVGIRVIRGRGKDPLPRPLARGADVLLGEGAWQRRAAAPSCRVLLVEPPHRLEVIVQIPANGGRQERDPVLGALAVVDRQLVALEVDILDPKGQALLETQPRAVEQPQTSRGVPLI